MAVDFIARFAVLHQHTKKGPLPPSEQAEYEQLKERFAAALCVAQQIMVRPGQRARSTFRIAVLYNLKLTLDGAVHPTVTVDVSMGGFSALIAKPPREGKGLPFTMSLGGKSEPIAGAVDLVGTQGIGANLRGSFKFSAWKPGDQARLEEALFDAVLGRFVKK